MAAHAAAFMVVRALCTGRFLRMDDIDVRKHRLKLSAAAFGAFDALVRPVAHGCHNIENLAATAFQIIKRQVPHLRLKNSTALQFIILRKLWEV
jgi:hypothetical protein